MFGLIFNAFSKTFQSDQSDYQQIERDLRVPSLTYRQLTDEDVNKARELAANSEKQLARAKEYTTAIRTAVLNESLSRAEFIRKFGSLRSAVDYNTKSAYIAVQEEDRKYQGLLANQRSKLKTIARQYRLKGGSQ